MTMVVMQEHTDEKYLNLQRNIFWSYLFVTFLDIALQNLYMYIIVGCSEDQYFKYLSYKSYLLNRDPMLLDIGLLVNCFESHIIQTYMF